MKYLNTKTGLVFEAGSPIQSPDIELIETTGAPAAKAGKAGTKNQGKANGRKTTVRNDRRPGDALETSDARGNDEG